MALTRWPVANSSLVRTSSTSSAGSAARAIKAHGFRSLALEPEQAEWAGALPPLHRDPFDRLLVAQAHLEGLTLVTMDPLILNDQVARL